MFSLLYTNRITQQQHFWNVFYFKLLDPTLNLNYLAIVTMPFLASALDLTIEVIANMYLIYDIQYQMMKVHAIVKKCRTLVFYI